MKPERPSHPDRHERVTGKVKVDLQGIGRKSEPGPGGRKVRESRGFHLGPERANVVCKQYLAPQPEDKQRDSVLYRIKRDLAVFQFAVDIRIFHDWAGNQLREEDNKRPKVNDIALYLDLVEIDVDGIGHNLEGVKADPERQVFCDLKHREGGSKQRIEIHQQEIAVFEKCEESHAEHHRNCENPPAELPVTPPSADPKPGEIVDQNNRKHDWEVSDFPPRIKNQAYDQKGQIFAFFWRQIVSEKCCRQKPEKKQQAAENHPSPPFLIVCIN